MNPAIEDKGLARLVYSSRPEPRDAAANAALVQHIVEVSARNNAKVDVTGSLLFVDDCFVQALEGPVRAVETVFERICNDFRHADVRLVDFVMVEERMFPSWEMACLCDDQTAQAEFREDMQEVRFLLGINARQAVEQMRLLVHGLLPREAREPAEPAFAA